MTEYFISLWHNLNMATVALYICPIYKYLLRILFNKKKKKKKDF